ncbi:MAG: BREX-3 system P-loop-containing protein BrxF [Dethiobacteria bacterium]|jgi:Cdc6-like AAA superfamily ATPase|nr:BREX-3 system P-loop-containing protein BrxF [Bacillota bacterium]
MNLGSLKEQVRAASERERKLVLVVGPPGSGKSRLLRQLSKKPLLNVTKELSRKLHAVPSEERPRQANEFLAELVNTCPEPILILDNIEILFLPELQLDPLQTLADLSIAKTLVVGWLGRYDGEQLVWAEPGHPQYRVYSGTDFKYPVVSLK